MLKGVPLLFLSLLAIRGGWHQVNASQECVAPLSYRGPCPRFLQMENKTAQKRLLEGECRIFW
ncbi:hypothetical protein PCYB_132940 [Plasmodium cynomolgi strain B]|uniref:CPW-WPC domain-containing protein n=1 Tax=Plasmodium cynomolgi (strain B) TaxID=1120755 RepID=K6V090_PLACD|nr:hypothetical protein PCYB_132940 [Plasmodium cynomolgi strain B]GAB68420.1 hypothetical protein PCYB_132940 [Plasmodium cynomolgi strain B]